MSSPVVAVTVSPGRVRPALPHCQARSITPSIRGHAYRGHSLIILETSKSVPETGSEMDVSPFFPSRNLFPEGVAEVETSLADPGTLASLADHVLLPWDLRDQTVDILEKPVRDVLASIFPTTIGITEGRYRAYVHFTVQSLPTSPWPRTVGGLPYTIATETEGRGPVFPGTRHKGNPGIRVLGEEFDANQPSMATNDTLRSLASALCEYFEHNVPGIGLPAEIIWTAERFWYVVLNNKIDLNSISSVLPGKIARCPVRYMLDKDFCRPRSLREMQAKRMTTPEPWSSVIDGTDYEILRPGVMVTSTLPRDHGHPSCWSTTLGVKVKTSRGDTYVTAAAHGVENNGVVCQKRPHGPSKVIGYATYEIPFTDVALVQLVEDVSFENKTFEPATGEAPKFTRLFGEDKTDTVDFGDSYFLNSAFTGEMEGVLLARSVKVEPKTPAHPRELELCYSVYDWCYVGQIEGAKGKEKLPDGTRGSVIWDQNGVIRGFFRYYLSEGPWAGFCASISAKEVVNAGYQLA